jgi:peptide/nickel transport system ATP-binding protein
MMTAADNLPQGGTVLQVKGLKRFFDVSLPWLNRVLEGRSRQFLKAVDGVNFTVEKGKTFALVGESGCGKSTVANLVVGLFPPTAGAIEFHGHNMNQSTDKATISSIRRRISMIFQNPYASLNPRWRVFSIISEPIRAFGLLESKQDIADRTAELLEQVGLSPDDGQKYPHEFSGGQRQRICIARALASEPEFIVCDEPTSALDVSVQAQILNLMKELQEKFLLSYLFISHDLAVVRHMADDIGVMYLGRLCEVSPADTLFENPRHPYTKLLLDTIPDVEMTGHKRAPVAGEIPNPISPPPGCTFHPRCPWCEERCKQEQPTLISPEQDVMVACHTIRL